MVKCVDVSSYQGDIDWNKVKGTGINNSILKVIRKDLNPDKKFEKNYKNCILAGIDIKGVYNYSYATTVEKAKSDAKKVLDILNGRKLKVYLDAEDKCQQNLGFLLIDIINAYKEVIESAGYEFGLYTGMSFYNSYIKPYLTKLNPINTLWIARYYNGYNKMNISVNPNEKYNPSFSIGRNIYAWQYTSSGIVNGIIGNVDLSTMYMEGGILNYSLKYQGEMSISKNFKVKEFKCKDGSDSILIDCDFVQTKLQKIRDHFGKPVIINSAYRTENYNKKVGGAKNSYHMKGMAFDIKINGINPVDIAKYCQLIGIKGIIKYNSFVHVDSRTSKYWAVNNNGKITTVIRF